AKQASTSLRLHTYTLGLAMLRRPGRCVSKPRDFRRVPWPFVRPSRKLEVPLAFQGLGARRRDDGAEPERLPQRASGVARELSILSGMGGGSRTAVLRVELLEG